MSDGIQAQEVVETPQEIGEISEAKQDLDKITNQPEAELEKRDHQPAELLQEAFVAVLPPVQSLETPPAPQESAPETGQESGGKSGFGSQNTNPADHYSGVNMTQREVVQDSDWNEGSGGAEPPLDQGSTPIPPGSPVTMIGQDGLSGSSINSKFQVVMDNIEGQTETVKGAAASLKMANELVSEIEETLDELQGEAPVQGEGESDEDYAARLKAYQVKVEDTQKDLDQARKDQETSNITESDLPQAAAADAADMENNFEQEKKSLGAMAEAMQTYQGTEDGNNPDVGTVEIRQEQRIESIRTTADPPLDLSASMNPKTTTISGTGPMAAQNPSITGGGVAPAAGLGIDEERNDQEHMTSSGDPTPDPARSYSGVEMAQVEVLQDSDWNQGSLDGEEPEEAIPAGEDFQAGGANDLKKMLSPLKNNLGALREMVVDMARKTGGSLTIEAALVPEPSEAIETDQLANQDIQNQLQKQQQLVGMLKEISKLLDHTAAAVKRNADGGSTPTPEQDVGDNLSSAAGVIKQELDAWEDELNSVGEDANLSEVDLGSLLQKQERAINLLSEMSAVLIETTSTAAREMELTQPLAVQGQELENTADSSQENAERQIERDAINDLREESLLLEDELSDWPAGEQREITYSELVQNEDGSYSMVEKTESLSKDEVKSILGQMEDQIEKISEELAGTNTTGTATLQEELASTRAAADWQSAAEANMIDTPRDTDTGTATGVQTGDGNQGDAPVGGDPNSETDELMDLLGNLEATRHRLEMDIAMLRDFIQHHPPGEIHNLTIHLPTSDGEGGYRMVPLMVPVDSEGAANLLMQQEGYLSQIMAEIAAVQNQLGSGSGPPSALPTLAGDTVRSAGAANLASDWQDTAKENAIEDPRLNHDPNQSG